MRRRSADLWVRGWGRQTPWLCRARGSRPLWRWRVLLPAWQPTLPSAPGIRHRSAASARMGHSNCAFEAAAASRSRSSSFPGSRTFGWLHLRGFARRSSRPFGPALNAMFRPAVIPDFRQAKAALAWGTGRDSWSFWSQVRVLPGSPAPSRSRVAYRTRISIPSVFTFASTSRVLTSYSPALSAKVQSGWSVGWLPMPMLPILPVLPQPL